MTGPFQLVIILIVAAFIIVFSLFALINVMKIKSNKKITSYIVILLLPFFGAPVFLTGKNKKVIQTFNYLS